MKQLKLPMMVGIVGVVLTTSLCFADLSGSLDESNILLRIKPEGEVNIETGGKVQAEASAPLTSADMGKRRYEQTCHICHGPGLAGAPKWGDGSDWAPRIAEGMDTVYKRAIQGYKGMPPKGTCIDCSDDEIKKAVDYMISKAK